MKKFLKNYVPLLATIVLGSVFYIITKKENKEYPNVMLNPPKIIFPIAWGILYLLIGISIYFFDKENKTKEQGYKGYSLYYFDLYFNCLWTLFFFTLNKRTFALIWLIGLYLIAASRYFYFKRISKTSAYLLLPYLAWLIFALYLNASVVLIK